MTLDSNTLAATYVLLSAMLGVLLLFSWMQNRAINGLAWWGSSFCLVPIGIGMANFGQGIPGPLNLGIANTFVVLGYGAMYAGCRSFTGFSGRWHAIAIGPVIWIAAVPFLQETVSARVAFLSFLYSGYAALSGWELWRHASQRLISQRAAVILLAVLATFNFLRGVLGLSLGPLFGVNIVSSRWPAEVALFLVAYAPALAFVLLAMAKECIEAQQEKTKQALRESEEHYRYSVEFNPQIPWTADAQGSILSASSRWQEITGLPVDEGLGRGWLTALHPDDLEPTRQSWWRSFSSGDPFDTEYRLRLIDGSYRWFRARAMARRSQDGAIVRWYGTLEDIQEEKLGAERLRWAASMTT